ncbi:uncharacterized protein LOC122506612 isoform X2 [Leptopilina heterotoma]|uniref:uncharacterized protein LOC122506612 isoform X2 n=1 Tax=Leptopilina heterotoma TaxID=63436 RepID=UPI001CA92869|nr:uncharacterized protein LOC122506612 isoform X2 [Leptopilina heterotoma]
MKLFLCISLMFIHMLFAGITRALHNQPELKIDACPELENNSQIPSDVSYPTCLDEWEPLFHEHLLAEIFEIDNPNLIIILSENLNDDINLARFLTNNNRLLPKKTRNMFSYEIKLHYDFIVENFIAYQDQNQSTTFLTYPRNTKDEFLAQEIVIQSVSYAETVQLILTISNSRDNDPETKVRDIFEIAGKMIKNVKKYRGSYLFIVTNGNLEIDERRNNTSREKKEEDLQEGKRNFREAQEISRQRSRVSRKSGKRIGKNGGRGRKNFSIEATRRVLRKIIKKLPHGNENSRRNNKNVETINRDLDSERTGISSNVIVPSYTQSDEEIFKIMREVNCNGRKSDETNGDLQSIIRELQCSEKFREKREKSLKVDGDGGLGEELRENTGKDLEELEELSPDAKVRKTSGNNPKIDGDDEFDEEVRDNDGKNIKELEDLILGAKIQKTKGNTPKFDGGDEFHEGMREINEKNLKPLGKLNSNGNIGRTSGNTPKTEGDDELHEEVRGINGTNLKHPGEMNSNGNIGRTSENTPKTDEDDKLHEEVREINGMNQNPLKELNYNGNIGKTSENTPKTAGDDELLGEMREGNGTNQNPLKELDSNGNIGKTSGNTPKTDGNDEFYQKTMESNVTNLEQQEKSKFNQKFGRTSENDSKIVRELENPEVIKEIVRLEQPEELIPKENFGRTDGNSPETAGSDELHQDMNVLDANHLKHQKDLSSNEDFDETNENTPTSTENDEFHQEMKDTDRNHLEHLEVLKSNQTFKETSGDTSEIARDDEIHKNTLETKGKTPENKRQLQPNENFPKTSKKSKETSEYEVSTENIERSFIKLIREYSTAPNGSPNGKLLAEMIDEENVIQGDLTPSFQKKLIDRLSNIKRVPAKTYDYESQLHRFLKCLFKSSNIDLQFAAESLVSRIRTNLHSSNHLTGMTTLTSIFTLSEKLNTTHEALSSFLNCIIKNEKKMFNKCSDKLLNNLKTLGLDLIEIASINENFSVFCWTGHIFNSTDIEYDDEAQKWITIIENYLQDLKYPRNWFLNLRMVFDDLKPMKNSLTVDEIDVKLNDLMKQVVNHVDYDSAFLMHAVWIVKEDLRNVTVNVNCQRESVIKLKVTGEFLRLSQILNNTNCPNYQILEIFALEKIVIDCDIIAIGENIVIAIFAPVWEIVMNRRIILDGASRNLTDDDYMVPKGRNGNTLTNRNGVHGLAGLPGGPAGAFYGLAEKIISVENLTISLNGGNGSNGQNGGDGANGENGETPSKNYIHSMFNNYHCKWLNDYRVDYFVNHSSVIRYYKPLFGSYVLKYIDECYIYGLNGFPGGNGGDGGTIGAGGSAGDFHFYSLGSSTIPLKIFLQNGTDGTYGIGGKNGIGGYTHKVTIHNKNYFEHEIINNETCYRARDGRIGKNNHSTLGTKIQKFTNVEQTFPQTVNLYKRYLLANFQIDNKYVKFYQKMISNREIINTYNTMSLVNELIDLEKYYFRTDDKKKTIFIYKSWRERLIHYSLNRKEDEKSEDYTALLRNLNRIISDKIQRLEKNSKEHLVFMIADYLSQCNELSKYLQNARTVLRIKKINSNFIKEYDDKVKEAQQIIQEKLHKDIEQMNQNLKGETEMLLGRIMSLTERERKSTEELSEKSKRMEGRLMAQGINEIFEMINTVLGVINPALGKIGTKFSTAGSIVQNFIDETADSSIVEVAIPSIVDRSREFFNNWVDLKSKIEQISLAKCLDLIDSKKRELVKHGSDVKPLESLSSSLQNLDGNYIETKIDDKLTKEKTIWEKLNLSKKHIYDGALKAIGQIRTFTRMKQMLGDLSEKFDDIRNPRHLNELTGEIHRAFEKTVSLRNFKEDIYKRMMPLIRKIRDETDLGSNLTESVAYLDFKKFQMKEYFQQVLEKLEIFIGQFKLKSMFEDTMGNMKNVIDMVLGTYERIQEYVETMKKANYESDLYLAPFDLTYIKNPKLSMALAKMVQTIYANNVLDNYTKWMTSFKQYIFPFADDFLDYDSSVLPQLNGILARAEEAGKHLNHLEEKLLRKRAEFVEFERTYPGKFGLDLPPFHIWNNSLYKMEIKRILKGESVTLFADVFQHKIMNAVKFREIWLRVRLANLSHIGDENLRNDLKGFAFKLVHEGDSYYRCDDGVYLITTNSYLFERVYSALDDDEFRENDNNGGFSGKQKGDYLLSPYATWRIELISRDANKNFKMLRKYISKVNLELVGFGRYTDRPLEICRSNLTKYYVKM